MIIQIEELREIKRGAGAKGEWILKKVNNKYGMFEASWNAAWKVGDTISVEVETKQNGTFTNHTIKGGEVTTGATPVANNDVIEEKLDTIIQMLNNMSTGGSVETGEPAEETEDIPF